ncbi:U3 small nucleolar ribonucleoprotein IMP3 [Orchesella cincta]|uniref:U3 small nucleolar ribonucleoprotein protein IMP3 n=1 Tax=Orchesella cincta TaxID=48709 RepID=A0A1D2MKT9_ORCCI|nr:U3 small nucleolar ribonucleoprotein IMP3 [Orchesella cincta]
MRKLKYHEQKLLKKVDFINWEADNNLHEVKVMKKYHVQKREDYTAYNKLSRKIREMARRIKDLDPKANFRLESGAQLLEKLYTMGLIPARDTLEHCDNVSASSFCRLPVVMVRNRMAQTIKDAVKFIEQGHVRVGVDKVTDPAFLVTRTLEDFVTWTNASAIKKHVLEYNATRDDYELL